MKTFRNFLIESSNIETLRSGLDALGVDHHISQNSSGALTVHKIVVAKEKRNAGLGTNAMHLITQHADKYNNNIHLTPSNSFGGNVNKLKTFYKRHGFVDNKGKNKDWSSRESMIRYPNDSK
jgi:GNAT superfamily N-acetyltransferase